MSDLEKGATKLAWMTVGIEATSFLGMLITGWIYPHKPLFMTFTVILITIAVIFLLLCAFIVKQVIDLSKRNDNKD